MVIRTITAPTAEPVTVEEQLQHLRIEGDEALAEGDRVQALIVTARQHLERVLWRAIMAQTLELVLPCFPRGGSLDLPRGQLLAVDSPASPVTHVKYVDGAGALQTMSTADYSVDSSGAPGVVRLAYGASWPSHRAQWDAVQVRYQVGWAQDDVPRPLKSAVLLLVEHLNDGGSADEMPEAVKSLVATYSLAEP